MTIALAMVIYTEQQKKRIFCIFGIVYKSGLKYWSNDMKGITDVLNMWIIKCITNGWLIGIMMIKGHNSGRYKITHNKGDFRDCLCIKPPNGFEWKSLCVIIMTYRLRIKFKFSDIFNGWLLWPCYIIEQLTGSVFNTGMKGSKQLLETVLLDTTLLDINHTVPDIFTPKRFQWYSMPMQKCKKWRFLN